MNTNLLQNFAKASRLRLLEDVKNRFLYWGLDKDGNVTHQLEPTSGGYIFRGSVSNDTTIPKKWNNLQLAVSKHSSNDIIEEAAYVWFNRLMTIKI